MAAVGQLCWLLMLTWLQATAAARSLIACSGSSESIELDVSTSDEVAQLSSFLLQCRGKRISVSWRGELRINQTLEVLSGTFLSINGSVHDSIVDGGDQVRLFNVEGNGSTLHLERLALKSGRSEKGGAVTAHHASLELQDCKFYGNNATSAGGK